MLICFVLVVGVGLCCDVFFVFLVCLLFLVFFCVYWRFCLCVVCWRSLSSVFLSWVDCWGFVFLSGCGLFCFVCVGFCCGFFCGVLCAVVWLFGSLIGVVGWAVLVFFWWFVFSFVRS